MAPQISDQQQNSRLDRIEGKMSEAVAGLAVAVSRLGTLHDDVQELAHVVYKGNGESLLTRVSIVERALTVDKGEHKAGKEGQHLVTIEKWKVYGLVGGLAFGVILKLLEIVQSLIPHVP